MTATGTIAAPKTFLQKLLDDVEVVGNKVPHPAIVFLIMAGILIVLSHLLYLAGTSVSYQIADSITHEIRTTTATANSLLTAEGIRKLAVAPAAVLAAYRVGDSPGNVITPLMAYFGMIVIFVQRYQKDAGLGTVVAMMLPYAAALYVVWTVFLIGWYLLGIPFGPA